MPCACEKKSYLDSYDVVVDNIKTSQPDLSDHEVRVTAAQWFRPYFREIKASGKIENSGQSDYQNGEFTMIDGKMFFPKEGVYAETLHENQLRLSQLRHDAGEYSPVDHQTTLLLQQAFRDGATNVVTSFHREDGQQRDIVEYFYNPITRRGTVQVHAQVEKLDFVGVKLAVQSKYRELKEVTLNEKVFIRTDVAVDISLAKQAYSQVEQLIKMPKMEARADVSRKNAAIHERSIAPREALQTKESILEANRDVRIVRRVRETVAVISADFVRNPRETAVGVRDYVEQKWQMQQAHKEDYPIAVNFFKKSKKERSTQKLQERKEILVQRNQLQAGALKVNILHHVTGGQTEQQTESRLPKASVVKKETGLDPKATLSVFDEIIVRDPQLPLAEMQRKRPTLARFETFEKVLEYPRRKRKEVQKTIQDKVYPSYVGLQPEGLSKQLRGVYTRANSFASGIKEIAFPKRESADLRFKSADVLLKQRKKSLIWELRRCLQGMGRAKQDREISKSSLRSADRKIVVNKGNDRRERIALKPENKPKGRSTEKLLKKKRDNRQREMAVNFLVAVTVWSMDLDDRPKQDKQETSDFEKFGKDTSSKALVTNEPRPFLLLSVIWYLAKLREQGMVNRPINKYTNTTNKPIKKKTILTPRLSFPPQGIIFSSFS